MRNACDPARRFILSSTVIDDTYLTERLRTVEACEAQAKLKASAWEEARNRLNDYWDANATEQTHFEVLLEGEFILMEGRRSSNGARVWRRRETEEVAG
jgi:hypothetical protein